MGTRVLKTIAPTTKKPMTLYLAKFFIVVINLPFLRFNIRNSKAVLKISTSCKLLGYPATENLTR